MFGKLIGAFVGGEVQRSQGGSGLKGAAIGALAIGAMRRLGPLGLILGGAYAAKKVYDRNRTSTSGSTSAD